MSHKLQNISDCLKNQKKNNKINNNDNILDMLSKYSISLTSLEDAYIQLYVPHPGIETKEKAIELFRNELKYSISDPNLCLLIYCGVLLEKEGINNTLPFINKDDYDQDLSFIIADEIIGEVIAEYIGGHKGRFEFVRFDKIKPGILSTLGPFLDDVIAGLLGGISANIYSKSIYKND